MPILRCIMYQWRVCHYRPIFLFELFLFFLLRRKFSSKNSIYLYVSTNEPGIKSEISGVMWKVSPEYKIQLVSCELSPKYIPVTSSLEDIHAIYVYILCDSLWSVLLSDVLSIFIDLYAQFLGFSVFQWNLFSKISGFRQFAIKWSSYPHLNHIFGFRPLRSVRLLLGWRELKDDLLLPLPFFCCWKKTQLCVILHSDCTLIEQIFLFIFFLLNCPNSSNQFSSQI